MQNAVSEKGQVTIPKALRDSLGLHKGVRLAFSEVEGQLVAKKVMDVDPVASVQGVLSAEIGGTDAFIRELRGEAERP